MCVAARYSIHPSPVGPTPHSIRALRSLYNTRGFYCLTVAMALVFTVALAVLIMPVNDLEEDSDWEVQHYFSHPQWLADQKLEDERREWLSRSPSQPLVTSITHASYLSTHHHHHEDHEDHDQHHHHLERRVV